MTKVKTFADDKLNVAKITISLIDRVENTVGKGENAGIKTFEGMVRISLHESIMSFLNFFRE